MKENNLIIVILVFIFTSCEEVIDITLNSSNPAFVAEAIIYKDSVGHVHLTRSTNYFSMEESELIEDASISIYDGNSSEELAYKGNGYYVGETIIGVEGRSYRIEISHDGVDYEGISHMPHKTEIISLGYTKSDAQGIFNPYGEQTFTIKCDFLDDPTDDNFYMVRYILDGFALKGSYYLLTEDNAVNGSITKLNLNTSDIDTIRFSELIFYDGGEAEVQVFSIDQFVYNYFLQLNDVLYWKRRIMPPASYNPETNINNGAMGYFAAWAYDSETMILE
jgi:hypothetical protein